MVTIYVGPKRKKFTLHKDLICRSIDFFSKAFTGFFKEAQEGIMYMPEDTPGSFSLLVDYLYRGTVPLGNTNQQFDELYNLYYLAEKLCLPILKDVAMDRIQETCHKYKIISLAVTPEKFHDVFSKTSGDPGLREFTVVMFIYGHDQVANKKKQVWAPRPFDDKALKHIWAAMDGDFERFEAIIGASQIYMERTSPVDDPRYNTKCVFHCHEEGEFCGPAEMEDQPFVMEMS